MMGLGLGLSLGSSRRGSGGTPTPTPTPTPPVITYAAGVYSNSLGTSGQWYRDGSAISGQTGPTYTHAPSIDDYTIITQMVGALESNGFIIGTNDIIYYSTFDGARQDIATIGEGWTRYFGTAGRVVRTGSGQVAQTNNSSGSYYRKVAGELSHSVEVTIPTPWTGTLLLAGWKDPGGTMVLTIGPTIWQLTWSGGGTIASNSTGGNVSGDKFRIEIDKLGSSSYARVFKNGVRNDAAGGLGLDITSYDTGTGYGFAEGPNYNATIPSGDIPLLADMTVRAQDDAHITVGSVIVQSPTLANGHPYPVARLQGAYSTSTTNMKIVVSDTSGKVLQVSAPMAVSGGTFDLSTPLSSAEAQGQSCLFWVVDTADHLYGAFAAQTVGYFMELSATIPGIQFSNATASYAEADAWTDRGLFTEWRGLDGGGAPSGYPTILSNGNWDGSLPGSDVKVNGLVFNNSAFGYGRGGDYLYSWNTDGYDVEVVPPSGGSVTDFDPVARTATITVPEMDFITVRSIFTPDDPGFRPVGGVRQSLIRVGETATGPFNDVAIGDFKPSRRKILRWMKAMLAEHKASVAPDAPYQGTPPWAAPELMGLATEQTNSIGHFCLPIDCSDEWVIAWAIKLKTTYPAGLEALIELANELWNFQGEYVPLSAYAVIQAAFKGYISGVTAGSVVVDSTMSEGLINPYTRAVTAPIASGTILLASGWRIAKATRDLTTSDVMPAQNQGYIGEGFKILADSDQSLGPRHQWRIERLVEVVDLIRTVFGAQSPIRAVHGAFDLDTPAQLKYALDFVPKGSVDLVAVGGYNGLQNYVWGSAPSYITGYATQATFTAGLIADIDTKTAATVIRRSNQMQGTYSLLRSDGWTDAEVPRFMAYEGGPCDFAVTGVPGGDLAGLKAAFYAAEGDSGVYDACRDFYTAIWNVGMWGFCDFCLHDYNVTGGDTFRAFGYLNYVGARDDPAFIGLRWNAWSDHIEALPV